MTATVLTLLRSTSQGCAGCATGSKPSAVRSRSTAGSREPESTPRFRHRTDHMPEPLRVVIAEDNYLVREGTRRLLEDSGEVQVVAAVGTAEELVDAVDRPLPHPRLPHQ